MKDTVCSVRVGYLVDSNSSDGHKNYTPAFLLMAGMLVLDLLCSWKMKISPSVKPERYCFNLSYYKVTNWANFE